MITSPCSVCNKAVQNRQKSIECDTCNKWVHIKCNKLDDKDYKYHQDNPNATFLCLKCSEENLPFSKLNNNPFNISVKQGINYLTETNINYSPSDQTKNLWI